MTSAIIVNIKFFANTHQETDLVNYDYINGADFKVKPGTRLRTILKEIGFIKKSHHTFFLNCERIDTFRKLEDNDQISCLVAAGGG